MNELQMQHGIDYDGRDLTGYYMTEKYDGCRVYWDGEHLWSRGGIKIKIPVEWEKHLPKNFHLDCELYDGVGGVYRCGSAIRYGNFNSTMKLIVFDFPSIDDVYNKRIERGKRQVDGLDFVGVVNIRKCNSNNEANIELNKIVKRKGEGLIFRENNLRYKPGRYREILKFKKIGRNNVQ